MALPSTADNIDTNDPSKPQSADGLWHVTYNDNAPETVVLIHGLMTSHFEWMLVLPHLSDYHLIIPDLNGHSNSKHVLPTTISAQASRVADLIRARAQGGKAHIVGMSMGGVVALELARAFPDHVRSVFASGCAPLEGWTATMVSSPIPATMITIMNLLPSWISDNLNNMIWERQGLKVSEELRMELKRNSSPQLLREVFREMLKVNMEQHKDIKARVLVVAGGQRDNVEGAKKLGAALRDGCPASTAAVVWKATHAWDLQFSELFAEGIKAWIEERELPEEYVKLG